MTGIEMTHVPYKGSLRRRFNDVVAGHVPLMFGDFGPALPLIRAGKVRALGVTTAQRVAAAPEIPPLGEAGLPGYRRVLLADGGGAGGNTPQADPRQAQCARSRAILAEPEIQKDFTDRGIVPIVSPLAGRAASASSSPRSCAGARWCEQAGAAGSQ